jgi:hypothetical protein
MRFSFFNTNGIKFKRFFSKKRVHPIDIYTITSPSYDNITTSQRNGLKLASPIIIIIIVCIICAVV